MPLFEVTKKHIPKNLREEFLTPPLSILDAKTGYWNTRKRDWEIILQDRKNNIRDTIAKSNTPYINNFEKADFKGMKSPEAGMISTFDPFLCEILITWFSEPGMSILDPFAGSCTRGIISSFLNREYQGIDISEKQVDHNYKQWERIKSEYDSELHTTPTWVIQDAEVALEQEEKTFDMFFTCPPYYNLERYTDKIEDLSNKATYGEFILKYKNIIKLCYNRLRENAFAVIVVEEIRDKDGFLYGFIPDTINAFKEAGFKYYNELILENRVVSTAVRCAKYFRQSRKVGRHHQNILVFKK